MRDATRKARTAALATAALRLFLDRGVEAVTIDEIASRAGLAKGTFYTYFRDKGDVVEALLAPVAATIRGAFDRCEATLREAHDPAGLMGAYQDLAGSLADALAASDLPPVTGRAESLTVGSPFESRITATFVAQADFSVVDKIILDATYADESHDLRLTHHA